MPEPMERFPDWWPAVRARAQRPAVETRMPLHIDGHAVGSIALPLLDALLRAGLPVRGGSGAALRGEPTQALADIADWLRAKGHAGRWRNELLAVRAEAGSPVLARVERGVARNLGIRTTAVQLHAPSADGGGWWMQQRALHKATDPGLWDTLMGGLVAAGESITQALERETWEEAGVRLCGPVRYHGAFTVERPVRDSGSHGHMTETVHAFSYALEPGETPANQDGEVLRFETFSDRRIDAMVRDGQITLEAAVAIALCRFSPAA